MKYQFSSIVRLCFQYHSISRCKTRLEKDFGAWEDFVCSPRFAHYVPEGVLELMPIGNKEFFSYKYVNGHPGNVAKGHPSILALGQLSDCHTGIPLLMSEMTILTAIRTAATTRLVASYAARPESKIFGIVGNGSQSVFQTIAICDIFPIETIRYFDVDPSAMETYRQHISHKYPQIMLIACDNTHSVAYEADIVVTVTEQFGCHKMITKNDLKTGAFLAAIGGDCPGKTEIDPSLIQSLPVIVEYEPQTRIEGEIQHCPDKQVDMHIYELVQGKKQARNSHNDIILFDGVGFALEDYSILQMIYELLQSRQDTTHINLIPAKMNNIKDLFGYALGVA